MLSLSRFANSTTRTITLALIVLVVVVVSVRWGTFVAGGSDSYCYVHHAERWASGQVQVAEPLVFEAPWPDASRTFAPTGHVPSATVPGAYVPLCPAGLSIFMAPFIFLGGLDAAFVVVPLFGALLVLATSIVGARFGARIGIASACLVAASPTMLYQVMQPMSDVPAAALWMLAVAGATGTKPRDVVLAGLATSAAILVRPNLVPLGFVIGVFLLVRPECSPRERIRAGAMYAAGCVPGCVAVAWIQQMLYGSPLSSGYGSFDYLFAADRVVPNVTRYLTWLVQTHTIGIALAGLAVGLLPGPLTALFLALFLVNLALYLPYLVFEDASYLRFLLPTLPLLLILMVASVDGAYRRLRLPAPKLMLGVVTIVFAVMFVDAAKVHQAFRLQLFDSRFVRAGAYVATRLPAQAFIITSLQSGSVRTYGGRKTLVWDDLDPAWLDRAVEFLRARGYEPYLLFDPGEEPRFRARFAASGIGQLDWPPLVEIGGQVRIYDPNGREAYQRGEVAATQYAR